MYLDQCYYRFKTHRLKNLLIISICSHVLAFADSDERKFIFFLRKM